MARTVTKAISDSPQAEKQRLAHQAWDAHVALIRTAHAHPGLRDNEFFTALMDTARARFVAAFEVL